MKKDKHLEEGEAPIVAPSLHGSSGVKQERRVTNEDGSPKWRGRVPKLEWSTEPDVKVDDEYRKQIELLSAEDDGSGRCEPPAPPTAEELAERAVKDEEARVDAVKDMMKQVIHQLGLDGLPIPDDEELRKIIAKQREEQIRKTVIEEQDERKSSVDSCNMKSSDVYFVVQEQDGVTQVTLCPKDYWDKNKCMNDDSSWLYDDSGMQAKLDACGVHADAEVVEGTWESDKSPKDAADALRAAGFSECGEFTVFIGSHPM